MRIKSSDTIAGFPAIRIRELMRQLSGGTFGRKRIAALMRVREDTAEELAETLIQAGYIERDEAFLRVSVRGNALANARARTVRRETAERHLALFLNRVRVVNESTYYLFGVSRVVLFGSMLTDAKMVGDVDLGLSLKRKIEDESQREEAENQRIAEAARNGRSFKTFLEQICWPEQEVRLFLKSRSPVLSFHKADEPVRLGVEFRVLVDE